jgi:DNA modification methylase
MVAFSRCQAGSVSNAAVRMIRLHLGDCLDTLREMPSDSIDAVVTDPPYGLTGDFDISKVLAAWLAGEKFEHHGRGFMGAQWDSFVPGPRVWREVFRVLKPGGHATIFAGDRTVDLMGIAVRLGGFELRQSGAWCYWSGFPKSLDLSKEMDRLEGAEREVTGSSTNGIAGGTGKHAGSDDAYGYGAAFDITAPATANARTWAGYGTAVKPAVEPWLLLRKPISESSIARNVLRWGTGGLNIDACRFAPGDPMWPGPSEDVKPNLGNAFAPDGSLNAGQALGKHSEYVAIAGHELGRFPANLIHCPKASRKEREMGCEGLPTKTGAEATQSKEGQARLDSPRTGAGRSADEIRNFHPTVKPVHLMRWLVRLVTPPGGVVLDPFMGSGTTGMAAAGQGFSFIGCELDAGHLRIARARIAFAAPGHDIDAPTEATAGNAEPNQTRMF